MRRVYNLLRPRFPLGYAEGGRFVYVFLALCFKRRMLSTLLQQESLTENEFCFCNKIVYLTLKAILKT